MITAKDLHTFHVEQPLTTTTEQGNTVWGKALFTYEVTAYTDTRNLTETKCYLVKCTQRIVIINQTPYSLTPPANKGFLNYPAMLSANVVLSNPANVAAAPLLLNYSPRTINTAVQTALNQNDGTTISSSQQHTIGSSTSQTNTYGASASLGFMGDGLSGGLTADASESTTDESSTSDTTGTEAGRDRQIGDTDSMSIKDWGSYASVDPTYASPTWVWGQEYPWDLIQYRFAPSQGVISLPQFVQARLCDGTLLFPPSHLSQFGVDFNMQAAWLVVPNYPAAGGDSVQFAHTINVVTASHTLQGQAPQAYAKAIINPVQSFNFTPVPAQPLDLCLLALDAVPNGDAGNGAVTGFTAGRFLVPPGSGSNNSFKIVSGANNLLVSGSGFSPQMATAAGQPASLTIQFKILDDSDEYTLFLKHWKNSTDGCVLTIVINGDQSNAIVKHLDDLESQGGENNITAVNLRNNDFASTDYHDYLQHGLNTIEVAIAPESASGSDAVYCLRAVAVGSI